MLPMGINGLKIRFCCSSELVLEELTKYVGTLSRCCDPWTMLYSEYSANEGICIDLRKLPDISVSNGLFTLFMAYTCIDYCIQITSSFLVVFYTQGYNELHENLNLFQAPHKTVIISQ